MDARWQDPVSRGAAGAFLGAATWALVTRSADILDWAVGGFAFVWCACDMAYMTNFFPAYFVVLLAVIGVGVAIIFCVCLTFLGMKALRRRLGMH